jgi:uncharacterized membrane protein
MSEDPSAPPRHRSLFGRLRAYFLAGLVVTAPIVITLFAAYWFVTLFDSWIKPLIPSLYNPDHYLPFSVPGVGLIFALAAITFIGALAANLVGRTILLVWDSILHRTPIVRSVYKGTKQVFETIFSGKGASFRNVALIEWPTKGIYSLVFVSRELDGSQIGLEAGRPMYAVYMSTTPNPTSGYVYFLDKARVTILDMPVEDGLKLVLSMGLVFPDMPPNLDQAAAKPLLDSKAKKSRRGRAVS